MQRHTLCLALFLLLAADALAGCAHSDSYQALLPRPEEKIEDFATAQAEAPATARSTEASAALRAQIDQLVSQARTAHEAFMRASSALTPKIMQGAGAAPSSEAWIQSQAAYSALEVLRGGVVDALATLDHLYTESFEKGTGGTDTLVQAQHAVQALRDQEDAVLQGR